MSRIAVSLLAAALVFGVAGAAMAETATPSNAPVTAKPDRTTASKPQREEMAKHRAELKQKKADCRQQARDQKLSLVQRVRYVRKCIAS
jgi:ribosomal protein L29